MVDAKERVTRKDRLEEAKQIAGGSNALGRRLGYQTGSYISQLAKGHKPISDALCRKIERAVGQPRGWMDGVAATEPTGRGIPVQTQFPMDEAAQGTDDEADVLEQQTLSVVFNLKREMQIRAPLGTIGKICELVREHALEHGLERPSPDYARRLLDILR